MIDYELLADPNASPGVKALEVGIAVIGIVPGAKIIRGVVVATKELSLVTRVPPIVRKLNQLSQRGWTKAAIDQLVNNPAAVRAATNRNTGNPATAYIRADGHYIVRDNLTGDLVQMSDTRRLVGMGPGQWRPDSGIINPVLPGGTSP